MVIQLSKSKKARIKEIEAVVDIAPVKDTVADLREVHAADAADWLNELDSQTFHKIVRDFPSNAHTAQILLNLDPERCEEVLEKYTPYRIATLVNNVESDDSNDILHKLGDDKIRSVLRYLSKAKRGAFLQSLKHKKGTAGRLMVRNPVTCSGDETVKGLLSSLQKRKDLPETFLDIFVLDENRKVTGVVPIGKIVSSSRRLKVKNLANRVEHVFDVDTPLEQVIESFQQYDTITAPVVDSEQKVVGFITVDEVLDWLEEEGEQRAPKMFGVELEETAKEHRLAIVKRFSWLALNLVMALFIGWGVTLFEGEIAKVAVVAAFMSVAASMSGTAACQSASIMIRLLAPGMVKKDAIRTGAREIYFSCINGVAFGLLIFTFVWAWRGLNLGIVAALAIFLSMTIAGLVGVGIPVMLAKMRLDPAVGSSIITTSVTDAVSFASVLVGAAIFILHWST